MKRDSHIISKLLER